MAGPADAVIRAGRVDPHLFSARLGRTDGPQRTAGEGGAAPTECRLRLVPALLDVRGAIARQHLLGIDTVRAFLDLELFGAPLHRRFAVFGRDLVRIDQFLSEARGQWNRDSNCGQHKTSDYLHGISRVET